MEQLITSEPLITVLAAITLVLAVARLSRLVTTDTITRWLFLEKLEAKVEEKEEQYRAVLREELAGLISSYDYLAEPEKVRVRLLTSQLNSEEPASRVARAFSGLQCPYCVGFWLSFIVLSLTVVLFDTAFFGIWSFILCGLAVSYLMGAISSRLD